MRHRLLPLTFFLAANLSAFADDPAPFANVIPAKLSVYFGHDMGSVCDLELAHGKITFHLNQLGKDRATGFVRPTPGQWSEFIAALNEAKVYKWDGHYERHAAMPLDAGFYWRFELQLGEILFVSDGNSAFPLDGDIDPTKRKSSQAAFDLFISAVNHLIGRDFL